MEEHLKILGLSEAEIKVYQACLKLGSAKASVIAEHASIERQASYYTLRQLVKRGMITETVKSGVIYYCCVNPSLLKDTLVEEKRNKDNALDELSKKYHELNGSALPKPRVELYEGLEGFKTAAREAIAGNDKEVYSIIGEKVINFRPIFLEPYVKKRVKRGIRVKVISEDTPILRKSKESDKKSLREVRFLDSIIKGKDYEMAITQDKVIFLRVTDNEQIGIKIEDPAFAELQSNIFKLLWQKARK